jgi:hypothetical protein
MGEWRKLHNEELRDLYFFTSIIRIMESRRMRAVGHVAGMEEKRKAYRLLLGKPEGKRALGMLGLILERWDGVLWPGFVRFRIGTGGELL